MPGVLAQLLMLTTMMLTSMAIVKEKEIGTIEQLMVTPIKTSELILGKIAPFALIGPDRRVPDNHCGGFMVQYTLPGEFLFPASVSDGLSINHPGNRSLRLYPCQDPAAGYDDDFFHSYASQHSLRVYVPDCQYA